MGAKRKTKAANKHARQVGGFAQTSMARSLTMRELAQERLGDSTRKELRVVLERLSDSTRKEPRVVLKRLDEYLFGFARITTSTPLKRTAASVTRRLDFSKSESLSEEHEPQTKRQKLRKAEHSSPPRLTKAGLIQHIPTPKSDAFRARRNSADFAHPAREDLSSSGASEDDDSSYHFPTETDTESTSHESNSEWEEFTSDGTSSIPAEISESSHSTSSTITEVSTRAKHNVNKGTRSSRRLRRLGVQTSGSESDNVRAEASWQAHPRRPATGEQPSDSDDDKVEREQKKATSQANQKAGSKGKPRPTEKQVAWSPRAKYVPRNLEIVEQGSSSSGEESSSAKSTEDTESLTDSRDKKTRLRIAERKKHTRPLTHGREKEGRHITKSKVEATRRKRTPQSSLSTSDMDSEYSQEKDMSRGGKGSLPAKRDGAQHVTKKSKTFGSRRKRESSSSSSRKSEAPTQPGASDSFRFAAKNAQSKSPAKAHGSYADRRKSLRARRENTLSSRYSSDSSGDSDGEPSHLQRNAVFQSSKADIPLKRQAVNGSCIRLARKSTKALLSEEESASSDSSEGWLAVQSPRTGKIHVELRSHMAKNKTTRVEEEEEISHDATTSSEGSRDDIIYSKRSKVRKPQSRQPATRKQPKLQASVVGGMSRTPLVAGGCGESSHDHSSASQNGSDESGSNRKSGIVQHSTRGVSSAHQGPKRSHAHPIRLTKKNPIKRKRHPSSSSSHSTKEGLTTESESSQISSRDPRAESLASKRRSSKSGIGATQDTGDPVTRRSSIRTERDNNLAARKQLQAVVVRANIRHRPRGSSVISGTMDDSSSTLKNSQKNKVTQSKAVLSVQQGPQENSHQLKAVTSPRKKPARSSSHSSTEELVTSEFEAEEDEVGLKSPRVHSAGRAPRPPQPKTNVAKVGRKNVAGGSPVRAKDGDKSFRGSSSISAADSDSSGQSEKKATAQSQPMNLPARNRSRQQTAVPVEKVRATRSSFKAASRTFSPNISVSNLRR
ncbi:unnamed protein product [Ixodes persulcatus]